MPKKPMSEAAEEAAETPAQKRREGRNDNEVALSDIHAMYAKKAHKGGKKGGGRGC